MRLRAMEVQQRLFERLQSLGIDCLMEVSLPALSLRSRSRWFRADIVVFHGGGALLAVECKAYSGPPRGKRQRENYEKCGLPVFWCGADDIDLVAQSIASAIAKHPVAPAQPT